MTTISSSQKLAGTPSPTPSSTSQASAEDTGLFASLFGGVIHEDVQPETASDAEISAETGEIAAQMTGEDASAKQEEAAGGIIIDASEADNSEADETAIAMLAGLATSTLTAQTQADDEASAETKGTDDSPHAHIAMASLLSEIRSKERAKTEQKSAPQPKSSPLSAQQQLQHSDEMLIKTPTNISANKLANTSANTPLTMTKSAALDTASQIGSVKTAEGKANANQHTLSKPVYDARILPQAVNTPDSSAKPKFDISQLNMMKKDGHIAPKEAVDTIEAGGLKLAKVQRLAGEHINTPSSKIIAGEGLERAIDTAPKASVSDAANAQMPSAHSSASGGQSSQQGSHGQAQQTLANASMSDRIADMLDMMEDNWAETLVKRIERALGQKAEGIDFELNPRNLGRLRVNLSLVNDQTHIHMKTETASASQMITEAESKLAQMLEQSGMKLGQFSSQTGFGHQQANGGSQNQAGQHKQVAQSDNAEIENEHDTDDDYVSENKVNLKA